MRLPIYQVDAFTTTRFRGNPAAVVPLETWLSDDLLRAIAAENNLAETAYFVPREAPGEYEIRWWTPTLEVPLCGHATLATASVIFERIAPELVSILFHSKGGVLRVTRGEGSLTLDFPANYVDAVPMDSALVGALGGAVPQEMYSGFQWLVVYASEREVRELKPDFKAILELGMHAVIVTAPGDETDFVSRFFAPAAGVDEDPVTGSAHTRLTPFWSKRLGKSTLSAKQVSQRGGELECRLEGERVFLTGGAVAYLEGTIEVG